MKATLIRTYSHPSGIKLTGEYFIERARWLYKKYCLLKFDGHYTRIGILAARYGDEFRDPYNEIEKIVRRQEEALLRG